VHRDVSPHNVLVGTDGVARVLDFGIAKAMGREQITRTGQIKGKLAYVAPEQLGAGPVTRAADIYAAGLLLWETLALRRLFRGEDEQVVLSKLRTTRLPALSDLVGGVPPAFDAIIARATHGDPPLRYATAREMADAIEQEVPVAAPGEVADWVERVAGTTLAHRALVLDRAADPPTTAESVRPPAVPIARQGVARGGGHVALAMAAALLASTLLASVLVLAPSRRLAARRGTGEWQPLVVHAARVPTPVERAAREPLPAPAVAVPAQEATPSARPACTHRPPPPDCAIPYTLDADGIHHMKPQCL
jgi:eukaryotic-like serine/threonine-protein kinase